MKARLNIYFDDYLYQSIECDAWQEGFGFRIKLEENLHIKVPDGVDVTVFVDIIDSSIELFEHNKLYFEYGGYLNIKPQIIKLEFNTY